MNTKVVNITLGKEGCIAFSNGEYIKVPAFSKKVVDRVGAGDTVLGITAACFANGIPNDLGVFIGNLAAAEKVAHTGTSFKLNKIKIIKFIQSLLK